MKKTIQAAGSMFCLALLAAASCLSMQAQTPDPCEEAGYVLSTAVANVSCFGGSNGSATIASTGCECAFSGCTFLWSDGQIFHTAENLAAGTYGVTVTHPNGCVMDTSVTVGQPAAFVDGVETQAAGCHNGSDGEAEVMPSGSAGPLTFLWSTGQTGQTASSLTPGEHSVTVTNLVGCTIVDTFAIDAPPPTALTFDVSPTCAGQSTGSATATPDGSNPPYSFLWNDASASELPTAENLPIGTYRVTVTDGSGCTTVSAPVAVEAILPNVAATSSAMQVCSGEAVSLQASGGVGYLWSPAALFNDPSVANPTVSLSESTQLSVLITTAEGCTATRNLNISVLPAPQPSAMAVSPSICPGQSTQLIASNATGAASFQWHPSDGLSNAGINAPVASPSQTTTYTVVATDANGCTAQAEVTVLVDVCSGIGQTAEDAAVNSFSVRADPAGRNFSVFFATARKSDVSLSVYNAAGMKVYGSFLPDVGGAAQTYVDLAQQPGGLYLVQLQAGGQSLVRKLLVR